MLEVGGDVPPERLAALTWAGRSPAGRGRYHPVMSTEHEQGTGAVSVAELLAAAGIVTTEEGRATARHRLADAAATRRTRHASMLARLGVARRTA